MGPRTFESADTNPLSEVPRRQFSMGRAVGRLLALTTLAALPATGCFCLAPPPEDDPGFIVLTPTEETQHDADPYLLIDFGDVDATIGVSKSVLLQNNGNVDVNVTEICLVDAAFENIEDAECSPRATGAWTLTGEAPMVLEPGASERIDVAFSPTEDAPGIFLRVRTDDPEWPVVVLRVVGHADFIPGTLTGCICNDGFGWVEQATVTVEHAAGVVTATTDEDGCFLMLEVPSGQRVAKIRGASYEVDIEVNVEARLTNTIDTPEECASPVGAVVGCACDDVNYNWVAGGTATIPTEDGPLTTPTDADGCYFFETVPFGPQQVNVTGPNGFDRTYDIDVIPSDIVAVETPQTCLPPLGVVTGCICDTSVYEPVGAGNVTLVTEYGDYTATTDASGCFSINDAPSGTSTLNISGDTSGGAYQNSLEVTIYEDEATVLDGPNVCAVCSYETDVPPEVVITPVDIVIVVDSSGSMRDENDAIAANLNAFSDSISNAGLDHRVVLIGRANVPPPLGNSNRFLRINRNVGSHNSLLELLGTYNQYDQFLRDDSAKHIVAITDDTSSISANNFAAQLNSTIKFDPGNWVFHSVVGLGNIPNVGCNTAAGFGSNYLQLSQQTGGFTAPVCGANFQEVFEGIYAAVSFRGLPCSVDIPPPPENSVFDPDNVEVIHIRQDGTQLYLQGPDPSCAGDGWRFDNPNNPTRIEACETTCEALQSDKTGGLTVGFGCIFD